MKDRSSFRFALLLGAVTMHPGLVWGQTAETSPRGDALEEIVVTAQKREQPIDSVGMTITAATAFQLRELGVNGVADLTKIEPSFVVSLNEEGQPFYQIRGIGFNSDSLAAPPAVTVYVDEIPYSYAPPNQRRGA
jgi:iron complex outermembrane recepter protein